MKPMFQLNMRWAAPIVIALVLALGLLAAASAGLFKDDQTATLPDDHRTDGVSMTNGGGTQYDMSRSDDEPIMPGRNRLGSPSAADPSSQRDADAVARRPLTRAELAALIVDAFGMKSTGLLSFTDVQGHPEERAIATATAAGVMDGFFDGTFRPEQPVTRADVAVATIRALELEAVASAHEPTEPIFRDVPTSHRAFGHIGMAHRLGLYPFHFGSLFVPDEPVELAEARQMIYAAAELERTEGPIAYTNPPARTISLQEDERRTVAYIVGQQTLIVRNDGVVSSEALRPGDHVRVYADNGGELLVAVATGPNAPTSTVVSEAAKVLRELATPEQLAAIIARDWEKAGAELKVSLYNQLLEAGLSAEEATALLEQDWSTVEQHGKERLTALVSDSASVDPELVRAVLDQDWDTAMSHIEVEVLEYVLNYLMETAPDQ